MNYEKAQPQFWKHAKDAEAQQTQWFQTLLNQKDHLLFIAENDSGIEGFIIGKLRNAPEVYNPGGLTLEIDDFCVKNNQWETTGNKLLAKLKQHAKQQGAFQILVVCGAHDLSKKCFLKNNGLIVASEWFVGAL